MIPTLLIQSTSELVTLNTSFPNLEYKNISIGNVIGGGSVGTLYKLYDSSGTYEYNIKIINRPKMNIGLAINDIELSNEILTQSHLRQYTDQIPDVLPFKIFLYPQQSLGAINVGMVMQNIETTYINKLTHDIDFKKDYVGFVKNSIISVEKLLRHLKQQCKFTHSDLHVGNLMVDKDKIILIDFGVSTYEHKGTIKGTVTDIARFLNRVGDKKLIDNLMLYVTFKGIKSDMTLFYLSLLHHLAKLIKKYKNKTDLVTLSRSIIDDLESMTDIYHNFTHGLILSKYKYPYLQDTILKIFTQYQNVLGVNSNVYEFYYGVCKEWRIELFRALSYIDLS